MKRLARAVPLGTALFFYGSGLLFAGFLTWEDCVRETLGGNPELAAAREEVRGARASYQGSFGEFLPQVSADADYTRAGGDGDPAEGSYGAGVSARQNLFAGGRDAGAVRRSRAQLDLAEAGYQATAARVGFELRTAFADLLFSQQQLELTETIASRRRENVRLVELRYEAGREHKGSFLRSRAAWRQAVFEVSQAKRALRISQRELSRVMGHSPFEVLAVTGAFVTSAPEDPVDFREIVPLTPDFRQAEARREAARAGAVVARGDLFPAVDASGSASRGGPDWPPRSNRWSAGLFLSYPIFSGGRDAADYRSARASARAAEANLKNTTDRTALELEESFASFQNAAERTSVQAEFLEAARVRAEIARSQYTSGLLSFEDWDLIENDLINNQKSWLASRRDAVVSEAAWSLAQGKGLTP